MKCNNFNEINENDVIRKAQEGDKEAAQYLLGKYRKIVLIKVRPYYLKGGDHEDLIQEGMIGLLQAIWDYDQNRQVQFKTFAGVCVERKIIAAIKSDNRQKHQALNSSISLYSFFEENSREFEYLQAANDIDPGVSLVNDERLMLLTEKLRKNLSAFEKKVLAQYIRGETYARIANSLSCSTKSIDNALQRIRKKFSQD